MYFVKLTPASASAAAATRLSGADEPEIAEMRIRIPILAKYVRTQSIMIMKMVKHKLLKLSKVILVTL